jgi:hypothetical protein
MIREHRSLIVWPSLVVAGLLAAACSDQTEVNSMVGTKPNFWASPPPAQCFTGKWTGGGRIDPPFNHDTQDETSGGQPPAYDPPPPLLGKTTFGFNVFLGQDANGRCIVQKGEIQVNYHPGKIAWHVSIHDGVDAYDGRPVFANEFPDGHPGGVCVVVGVPDNFMTARENGPGATEPFELTQFEVCDNDRGGPQNTRSDAMRWRSQHHGDTGLTYLTGGNGVDHSGP